MKKRILLFTAVAGMVYVTMSGNAAGPGLAQHSNFTGSTGGVATCNNNTGCHNNNQSSTTATIQLLDQTTSTPVSSYVPNTTYNVVLAGTNSLSTSLHFFGFQLSSTFASGANIHQQAGTLAVGSNMHIFTVGTIALAEHSSQIASVGGTNNYLAQLTWTAPAAGSGSVSFYAMLNAVNGDGGDGGDFPNAATKLTVTEHTVGISALNANVSIKAYPNPVANQLNLAINGAQPGTYTLNVFDINGRKLITSGLDVDNNTFSTAINTSAWAPGYYGVQIVKDGESKMLPVIKR